MLYTEKMLQKEIDRRLYEEYNARRFDQIEQKLYKLQVAVDKAHARLDAMTEKEKEKDVYVIKREDD